CVAHVDLYTPPLLALRNRQCLCGSNGHDMRSTRVITEVGTRGKTNIISWGDRHWESERSGRSGKGGWKGSEAHLSMVPSYSVTNDPASTLKAFNRAVCA